MIFLATKKATDTEINMIQSGYRPCTIAAVEVASEVAVSCAIVIFIFRQKLRRSAAAPARKQSQELVDEPESQWQSNGKDDDCIHSGDRRLDDRPNVREQCRGRGRSGWKYLHLRYFCVVKIRPSKLYHDRI